MDSSDKAMAMIGNAVKKQLKKIANDSKYDSLKKLGMTIMVGRIFT